ncbi:hypothetical protein CRG98_027340 [Punica granatum]|uniref:CCHC-type domain-containing protein n=1 Tax=Punica granatum TaxID=22663 RepID=A0A2I0J7R4_PUNGR|nr:hypothetical protein CRG98_027340 [Punica granatum]
MFSGGVAVAGTGGAARAGGSSVAPGRPMRPANIGPSSSGPKCFKCGEPGHRQSECRKGEKRAMFIEEELSDDAVYVAGGDGEVELDEEEEIVTGDGVLNLVKGGEVSVLKRALVTFSIGSRYRDFVWCDVIMMDACHLLGRPWQFDRSVSHNGRISKYSFMHKGLKIVLVPNRDRGAFEPEPANPVTATNLLSLARFQEELHDAEFMFALVGREVVEEGLTSCESLSILKEFQDVFPEELSNGLPPLQDIQHHIDL